MIKIHTVVLTDGSKDWAYLISGTKTNAKGNPAPYSKTDARHMAIEQLWDEEFAPYVNKRIGDTSVQQLSLVSPAYRWAVMEQAFGVKSHIVKSIREGDVSVSTKRNADGSKKRKRNAKTPAPAPKSETPAPAPSSGNVSADELSVLLGAA